jgi:hypothetical protein
MTFTGINHFAVLGAAVAAFAFGAAFYGALAKPWTAAVGMEGKVKPKPSNFMISFVCELVMAYLLAGLIGHLGAVAVVPALMSAGFIWLGFVITTMMVNHRYGDARWMLTLIDGAHWLGVLLVMALVIGWIGV